MASGDGTGDWGLEGGDQGSGIGNCGDWGLGTRDWVCGRFAAWGLPRDGVLQVWIEARFAWGGGRFAAGQIGDLPHVG